MQALHDEAGRLFDEKRFDEALSRYQACFDGGGPRELIYLVGRCHQEMERWAEAREVRIWTAARSFIDVARDAHRPLSGTEPTLAAYWPLGDVLNGITTEVARRPPDGSAWVDTPHASTGVARGGGDSFNEETLTTTVRFPAVWQDVWGVIGFRCCRSTD